MQLPLLLLPALLSPLPPPPPPSVEDASLLVGDSGMGESAISGEMLFGCTFIVSVSVVDGSRNKNAESCCRKNVFIVKILH